ncbi:MAG: DUF349 domain-containing protein [Luteitalea sp.]|nr:DUF349 domain-containing protein [Luteitalea sp.]
MSLLDRFRQPRWKHPDRAIRASAIEELGDQEQEVLRAVAREDEDPGIRRLATARLDDPALLAEIARLDQSDDVREEARALLLDIALDEQDLPRAEAALGVLADERDLATLAKQATSEAMGLAAVGRITSERILGSVARQATHSAVRLAALERVSNPSERLASATKSEHKDVALAALTGVTDPEQLEHVATRARNKLVARRARALLRAQAPATQAERHPVASEQVPTADEVCARLEGAATAVDLRLVAHRLEEADALWAKQDEAVPANHGLLERFEKARQQARDRLTTLEVQEAERRGQEEARAQAEAAHIALCERVEALEGDEIPEALAAAAAGWSARDLALVPAEVTERFARAVREAQARHARWREAQEQAAHLEALIRDAETTAELPDLAEAHGQWAELLKAWNAATSNRPGTAGPVQDGAVADTPRREAGLTGALVTRFRAAEARLAARAADAREAQAREQRQRLEELSALCVRLEAVVDRPDLTLKDADQAWRDVRVAAEGIGALPTRQDHIHMASRLRGVQTTLFAKLQEIREVDDWKRWANAGVQEEICQQVEALQEIDDILEVAPKLRELRQQWKQVSSGPRGEEGSALWQRFRAALETAQARCDAYFAQRAVEEADRVQQKQALCARAEALTDSTDWLRTAEELKQLQLQWQSIGSLRGEQARELAARFRSACDRFFTRRKEDLAQRKALWSSNQAKKETLIQQAEAIADTTNWSEGLETLKRLQLEWKAIGPVKRQKSEALWKRFRTACDRFFNRYKNRYQIGIEAAKETREQLIDELEALLPAVSAVERPASSVEPPAVSDVERPVVSDVERPEPADMKRRVESIWQRWRSSSTPLPGALHAALEDRFAAVYNRLVEAQPATFRNTSLDARENLRHMEQLCQEVEGVLSQLGMQPLKNAPAVALASLLKEALASNTIAGRVDEQTRRRTAIDTVRTAQAAWRALGPAPGEQGRLLTARFNRACRRFFDHQGGGPRKKASSSPRPQGNGRNQASAAVAGSTPTRAASDVAAPPKPLPRAAESKQSSEDA